MNLVSTGKAERMRHAEDGCWPLKSSAKKIEANNSFALAA